MKHTPGEWKAGRTTNTWCKVYADGRCVASIHPIHAKGARQLGDFIQEAANAHLIASAPELLEKLIRLTDYAEEWLRDCPGVLKDRIIKSSRNTIAKAKGEL